MSSPPSDLKKHLGFWMRYVSNSVSQAFARKLEDSGVTVAEWVVLREMYGHEAPISPSLIAEKCGLTRGAISKLMERLMNKKLVSRKEAEGDRRYQAVHLTKKGRELVPDLAALADQNEEEFFSALTSEERHFLKKVLMKIVELNKLTKIPTE